MSHPADRAGIHILPIFPIREFSGHSWLITSSLIRVHLPHYLKLSVRLSRFARLRSFASLFRIECSAICLWLFASGYHRCAPAPLRYGSAALPLWFSSLFLLIQNCLRLRLHALHIGTEHEELLVDVFVAAVDVIETADSGGAFCS